MDITSNIVNWHIKLGNENINPIEIELANTIGESAVHYDMESNIQDRENTFQ